MASAGILMAQRMERCIGCHACSLACARLVYKRLSWDAADIHCGQCVPFCPHDCLGMAEVPVDPDFIQALRHEYAKRIVEMGEGGGAG